MALQILPSFLAADLGHLADELRRAEASGADAIHLDIMDPTFVPNMSFGPSVVDFCRRTCPGFYRNVHLMMNRPDLYLDAFAQAGAQTIHPETPVARLEPYLGEVDEILVMTVHPGFGGQRFIADCLPKLAYLRRRLPTIDLMVDGGVDAETAPLAARAGANQLVAGSYLFRQPDMAAAVAGLRRDLAACAGQEAR